MKINKSNFGWFFSCIFLGLLLILSVYLGYSGWYFKTESSLTTDLEIGKVVQIDLNKNSANALSMNLNGGYLEGQRLLQIISVKNISEDDIFVRAKIFVYTSDNQTKKMDIVTTSNWQYNSDDQYYYFKDLVSSNDKVSLCSALIIPDGSEFVSNKEYIVTVVFEGLDSQKDPVTFWGNNPLQND